MINRHQRRRALSDGIKHLSRSGSIQLTIVPANQFFDPSLDPEIFASIFQFGRTVQQGSRPLCLTCDHEWTNTRCLPPAAYSMVRTHEFFGDSSTPATGLFSGICRSCWENKPDLMADCLDRYRKVWPDLRAADISIAPDGKQ